MKVGKFPLHQDCDRLIVGKCAQPHNKRTDNNHVAKEHHYYHPHNNPHSLVRRSFPPQAKNNMWKQCILSLLYACAKYTTKVIHTNYNNT